MNDAQQDGWPCPENSVQTQDLRKNSALANPSPRTRPVKISFALSTRGDDGVEPDLANIFSS